LEFVSAQPKKKGISRMVSGPNRIAIFGSSIFAIAGFYTDYDRLQHVVAAADNGNVFEVHWDQ
jgi:hypothetical protein